MSNIATAKNAINLTITADTGVKTLCAAVKDVFIDITSLFLANSSATPCLVTISDGTNSYEIEVPADGTVPVDVANLQASSANTAWTAQCASSVSSIYISGTHSYRR